MLTIRALLPHVQIAGGVRRFLELGNEFVRRGHHYAVFKPDVTPPDWFKSGFHFRPLDTLNAHPYDVTLCGDVGLLHLLANAPGKLRALVAIGDRYASKYQVFLRDHPDTLVIGNSSAWVEYLPGVKGVAIPGGVNLQQFQPGPRRPGPFTISVVGRIDKKREAIPVVLEAFRRLGWKDARVLAVTDEFKRLPWRFFSQRRRIEQVSGRDQDELVQHYRDSDVLVTMERTAGWSNPAAEAMACGVPVICTKCGTQDFADASTALVVPVDDVEALMGALRDVREKPAEAQVRVQEGLKRIRAYEWGRVAEGMLRVFEGFLAEAGGPMLGAKAES
ncbi:MAG: glycosyltransferase family 4 protein [Planctomycetes bacterium]|nr:glycosyltransferase family 4 protein [Planctomycetota bacterium]